VSGGSSGREQRALRAFRITHRIGNPRDEL
jgi:hypothetical protein